MHGPAGHGLCVELINLLTAIHSSDEGNPPSRRVKPQRALSWHIYGHLAIPAIWVEETQPPATKLNPIYVPFCCPAKVGIKQVKFVGERVMKLSSPSRLPLLLAYASVPKSYL